MILESFIFLIDSFFLIAVHYLNCHPKGQVNLTTKNHIVLKCVSGDLLSIGCCLLRASQHPRSERFEMPVINFEKLLNFSIRWFGFFFSLLKESKNLALGKG